MTKSLDLTKVSLNMTPKERAKLVIRLLVTGIEQLKNPEDDIPTEGEMQQVVNACPSSEAREYNHLISIKDDVWKRLLPLLELFISETKIWEGRVGALMYLLIGSPVTYELIKMCKHMPTVVTPDEYREGLEKARQQIKAEVLPVEGRHGLAHQEAYSKLVKDGKIEENGDYLEGWLWFMERYGKSESELMTEAVNQLKDCRDRYLKEKTKTNNEPFLWKDYQKYVGLNDEELAKIVREERPDELMVPTKEQYETWMAEIAAQQTRIQNAIESGELKYGKNKEAHHDKQTKQWQLTEVEGVVAGSYYDWPLRNQKFAGEDDQSKRGYHPLNEDCIELRYLPEKGVVWSGDLEALMSENHDTTLVASSEHDQGYMPKLLKNYQRHLLSYLEGECMVKVSHQLGDSNDLWTISFKDHDLKLVLERFKTQTEQMLWDAVHYTELIKAIEMEYFDGIEIVSHDLACPFGTVARAVPAISAIMEEHNERLSGLAQQFNEVGRGVCDHQFPEIESLLVNTKIEIDQQWVKDKLADVATRADRR